MSTLTRLASMVTIGSLLILSTPSYAIFAGFYTGLQAGVGKSHYDTAARAGLTTATKLDDRNFAGRAFFGYQIDEHWATEIGYTRYTKSKFNGMNGGTSNGVLRQRSVEIAGKGILPVGAGFAAYATVGAALLTTKADANLNAQSTTFTASQHDIHLLWGGGLRYELTQYTAMAASWMRTQARHQIRNLDFFSVNLAYHFG